MLHPNTKLRPVSAEIGMGVIAARPIPRGTLIWVVCDRERICTPAQAAELSPADREAIEHHGYVDALGNYVLCCDEGRYVNHACVSTTLPLGMEVEIAVRDVAPGDHITCEYSTLNLLGALRCRCGLPSCRGLVRGSDILRYWPAWDRLIRDAVECAGSVPQPLLRFARDRANVEAIIEGLVEVPSVRACLFPNLVHAHVPEVLPASPLWPLRDPGPEGTP